MILFDSIDKFSLDHLREKMSQDNIQIKKPSVHYRSSSQAAFSTSIRNRPVVFQSQHIDDLNRKHSIQSQQLDECSLQMTNDPNSCFYRRLSQVLDKQQIQINKNQDEKKLKLFEDCSPELKDYLKDKHGHIKSKFDKTFII